MEMAQAYLLERESFGQRLANLQQVQAMVADSHIELQAARLVGGLLRGKSKGDNSRWLAGAPYSQLRCCAT